MFKDRGEVGQKLSSLLIKYKRDSVILALARGGVIVGSEISNKLNIPLQILTVKKIGYPGNPEFALGALAPLKTVFWNDNLFPVLKISEKERKKLLREKGRELRLQMGELKVRDIDIEGKTAILVDDGVATGATAIAGALYAKKRKAGRVILATPVISSETSRYISRYFDIVLALRVEDKFSSVGEFYKSFPQIENKDILKLKI